MSNFKKKIAERREDRTRLDSFKKEMIQLKSTGDVCREVLRFLSQEMNSTRAGIYLWSESAGSFTLWPAQEGAEASFPLIDPFLIHIAANPDIYLRDDFQSEADSRQTIDQERLRAIRSEALRFFALTNARMILPLVINESLVGVVFLDPPGSFEIGRSEISLIEEVRSLAVMALSNSILYARLEGILGHMEEKVKERTQELENTQTQLVQSEKMASLGIMVAGIAHEINTPSGVIQAAAENIERNLSFLLRNLDRLRDQPEPIRAPADQILQSMDTLLAAAADQGPVRDLFRKKKELTQKMELQGIASARELASLLTENGLEANETMLANLKTVFATRTAESDFFFEFLTQASNAARNLKNLRNAIRSIVRIVKALKSYSHLDAGGFVDCDVHDCLENTLVIMGSVLKHRVEIERDFKELPRIQCNPDELSQVWTNLIQNASQALKDSPSPHIKVETAATDLWGRPAVRVSVKDNGPGIAPDVLARIWDPFFTTKDQGEGTGLGLSIVRNIVQKHQGKIDVETEAGKGAAFHVILPVAPVQTGLGEATIYKFAHKEK
ncbi:MAG: GHKL domain-containing protein [Leptospirales bacterium]|nr:GHKL domain-containing protein [Leptospirales bacterium]